MITDVEHLFLPPGVCSAATGMLLTWWAARIVNVLDPLLGARLAQQCPQHLICFLSAARSVMASVTVSAADTQIGISSGHHLAIQSALMVSALTSATTAASSASRVSGSLASHSVTPALAADHPHYTSGEVRDARLPIGQRMIPPRRADEPAQVRHIFSQSVRSR